MSVRAYRVNKIDSEKNPSFNCWHDEEILNFLSNEGDFYDSRNDDGVGMIEISTETLKKLLKKIKWEKDDYRQEQLLKDLDWAKNKKEDFITYYCF